MTTSAIRALIIKVWQLPMNPYSSRPCMISEWNHSVLLQEGLTEAMRQKEDACGECNTLYPWILGLEEADTSVQITVAGTGIEPGGAAVSWASFTWEGGSCSLLERPETSVELDITSADGSHIAECRSCKLWENERCPVNAGVVVSEVHLIHLLLSQWSYGVPEIRVWVFAAQHEADLAAGVGGDGAVGVFYHREQSLAELVHLLDKVQVQPLTFALTAEDPALPERCLHQLVVRLFKERLRRTNRVGGVCDDDIKRVLILFHELEAVAHV